MSLRNWYDQAERELVDGIFLDFLSAYNQLFAALFVLKEIMDEDPNNL